jgi:hypothetical protein
MRYFNKVLFPDASIVSEGWVVRGPELLPGVGAEGKFRETFSSGGLPLILDGTAGGGRVICSIWSGERIVTHVAVVSGAEPEDDTEILEIFVQSVCGSPVVRELAGELLARFEALLQQKERPFCVSLLMPLDSWAENQVVLQWQERWVASHLAECVEYKQ